MRNDENIPTTIQAEEALLGAILIESTRGDREAIDATSSIITLADFKGYLASQVTERQPIRSRIFYAMVKSNNPPHQIATAQTMNKLGLLQSGDCAYLCRLVSLCPCSLDYMDYAKAVKDYSHQRNGAHPIVFKDAI